MNLEEILTTENIEKIKHKAKKLFGVFVAVFSLLAIIGIFSFSPSDPSFNTVNQIEYTNNVAGRFGAFSADLLLQLFGITGICIPLVTGVWGGFLVKDSCLNNFTLRLVALVAGVFLVSLSLGLTDFTPHWPTEAGVGGAIGHIYGFKFGKFITVREIHWLIVAFAVFALFVIGISLLLIAANIPLALVKNGMLNIYFFVYEKLCHLLGKTFENKRVAKGIIPSGQIAADETGKQYKPKKKKERRASSDTLVQQIEPHMDEDVIEAPKTEAKKSNAKLKGKVSASGYEFPPIDLLCKPSSDQNVCSLSEEELAENASNLEKVLEEFGVKGSIVKVRPGPVVTLYELDPAPGTKTSRVIGLADDIARSMSAVSVRIAVVAGSNTIGIEMPNAKRNTVWLRELLEADQFVNNNGSLALSLGKDIGGTPFYADLAKMPHLLVAGTTGSGKSVGVNAMILSLLYKLEPSECRLIMIDPKMLELSVYNGIPHLLTPVVTDPGKAVVALKWAVREMEDRYKAMAQMNVRNITGYNAKLKEAAKNGETLKRTVQTGFDASTGKPTYEEQELDLTPLPYIVIIVDEMADLMLVAGKDVEAAIQRLAQMARAAGLHLIMATQRPSVDVITGTIKANFPTRISFQVTSKIDSRTILGEQGAEQLLGMGDMLYQPAGQRPIRVHGPFVKDSEVESIVSHLKDQGEPDYEDSVTEDNAEGSAEDLLGGNMESGDDVYDQAVAIVLQDRKVSTSYIQRKLRIGYNRAASIVDRMEEEGLVSEANHVGKREILVPDNN